ncbi:hypothetical protein AAE478_010420 [Parahypoxylon ruwenzoriense]
MDDSDEMYGIEDYHELGPPSLTRHHQKTKATPLLHEDTVAVYRWQLVEHAAHWFEYVWTAIDDDEHLLESSQIYTAKIAYLKADKHPKPTTYFVLHFGQIQNILEGPRRLGG